MQPDADPSRRQDAEIRHLHIGLSSNHLRPTDRHNLLLSFEFGTPTSPIDLPAIVHPNLSTCGEKYRYENWWYQGTVDHDVKGPIRIAKCDDYAVAVFSQIENSTDDFRQFTYDAYRSLLNVIQSTGRLQIVKIWNYLGGINHGDNDKERYRQFSMGRAEAFAEYGISDHDAPTGTAIGTRQDHGLTLITLATSNPFQLAENPRQISAYHYPRQYGPKNPKFGRAGLVSTKSHRLYLLSGTAAIVGHKSAHPYDVRMQLQETVTNLDSLCNAVSELERHDRFLFDQATVIRAYLRAPEEWQVIQDILKQNFKLEDANIVCLHGNICRRELLIEIDGVRVA